MSTLPSNEPSDDSSIPKTLDELLDWFEGTRNRRRLRVMVERMLTKGFHLGEAWNRIIDGDLLDDEARHGWIDRDGNVFGCNYANHERLLTYLGVTIAEVESRGWVRFSFNSFQAMRPLTERQQQRLTDRGITVDNSP